MPSRRDVIRMDEAEIRDFLETGRRIILVTNGPGGLPHPVPMNYGLDDDGAILITSFARSQKVRNLERDPRAALLVESGATYEQLKAVIAWCNVEILRAPEQVLPLMRRVRAEGALAQSVSETMDAQVRASLAKRVVLRCTPFRFASWDHSRLGGFY